MNCFQHASFTVFLRNGEGLQVVYTERFCWTLWNDAENKTVSRSFANWTMNFGELSTNELRSQQQRPATLPALSSVHMLNSSIVFGYRQVAALQQGNCDGSLHQTIQIEDFLKSTSNTKLNMHHVEFFFLFHALLCFHGVRGFPRANHAVNGQACERTQVLLVAIYDVSVHAIHTRLNVPLATMKPVNNYFLHAQQTLGSSL